MCQLGRTELMTTYKKYFVSVPLIIICSWLSVHVLWEKTGVDQSHCTGETWFINLVTCDQAKFITLTNTWKNFEPIHLGPVPERRDKLYQVYQFIPGIAIYYHLARCNKFIPGIRHIYTWNRVILPFRNRPLEEFPQKLMIFSLFGRLNGHTEMRLQVLNVE